VRLLLLLIALSGGYAQDARPDPREIVRKSVQLDQLNWLRRKDYTWIRREKERQFDSHGAVKSTDERAWEIVVLDGEQSARMVERNGKPLPPDEDRKEQAKYDAKVARLEKESPEERQRQAAKFEKERRRAFAFLLEMPDLYDIRLEGDATVDGRDCWVLSGTPKAGYRPKDSDAKPLLKIKGKLWIDKAEYQWVRLEAETTDTISYGLFLARLSPGAKLVFEQSRVNGELWLPKRLYVSGNGRIGLVKKLALDEETTWNNYRKFQVASKIITQ
jgi:hypothetical protein